MLIVKDDVYIIDFEGEPRRTLEERRRKAPAARDIAGLIRSIDYSATAALDARAEVGARRAAAGSPRALDDWRERAVGRVPGRLSRSHDRHPLCGPTIRRRPSGCSISSCWKRRSTRSATNWRTGRTGCACRWPARCASCRATKRGAHERASRRSLCRSSKDATPIRSTISARMTKATPASCACFCRTPRRSTAVDERGTNASSTAFTRPACSPGARRTARSAIGCAPASAITLVELEDPYRFPPILTRFRPLSARRRHASCSSTRSSARIR